MCQRQTRLPDQQTRQSVRQSSVRGGGGVGRSGSADVERRSIWSASPCSSLSDRRGRCACVRTCEVRVSVCLRGSSDLGGQRRRCRAGEGRQSGRFSSRHLYEMVAPLLLLLLLALRREKKPRPPPIPPPLTPHPHGPWRASRDDG